MPREWADRYAGQFDDGWDAYRERVFARQQELGILPAGAELSRHDPDVPDWDSLPADARRLAARMMEVFAGFLSHADHQIGRLLQSLKETGQFDNTLIMLVSDNGASPEGGPNGTTNELQFFNHAQEPLADSIAAIDELGGRPPSTTTRGAGPGRETPRSGGGSARPTEAGPLGRLHYVHNYVGRQRFAASSSQTVPAGRHELRFEFEATGKPDLQEGHGSPGLAQLYIDKRLVGQAELPFTTPVVFNPGGLTCGADPGSAVTPDYRAPFRFTGTCHSVTVDVSGDLITDSQSQLELAMARQ